MTYYNKVQQSENYTGVWAGFSQGGYKIGSVKMFTRSMILQMIIYIYIYIYILIILMLGSLF